MTSEQQELPLEWTVYDHYVIELRKGSDPDSTELVRQQTATNASDAIDLIEALRDRATFTDKVAWRAQEVDGKGDLYGLAGGVIYQIHVTPDLNTDLSVDA